MEPSDHMSLKNSTAMLWVLDLIVFGAVVALFFEGEMQSYAMFFTVVFTCVSLSVKLVYFIQCLQENKRNDPVWNHTVEIFPVLYCFASQVITIIVTVIAMLQAMELTLIQAFAKLDVATLYIILVLWCCHPITVWLTLKMFSVHRAYSCHQV